MTKPKTPNAIDAARVYGAGVDLAGWRSLVAGTAESLQLAAIEADGSFKFLREVTSAVATAAALGAAGFRAYSLVRPGSDLDNRTKALQRSVYDILPNFILSAEDTRSRHADLVRYLQDRIVQHLQDGILHAYGFARFRREGELPIRLPGEVLTKEALDWQGNTAGGQTSFFVFVRLIAAADISVLTGNGTGLLRPPGRPSRAAQIAESFGRLKTGGALLAGMSCARIAALIRNDIISRDPSNRFGTKGLSDDAISRALRRVLGAA